MIEQETHNYDVVLVWAGIMSATLATLLHELDNDLKIGIFEQLDGIALESSDALNNAGTWHSAFCELNYTPENPDWSVDISKALDIAEQFEISKQFWATLIQRWYIQDPKSFINQVPHCSLVFGEDNIRYLKNRYQALIQNHLFEDMIYTEDQYEISNWMPLTTDRRDNNSPIAATKMDIGTDVNFWSLTRQIISHLSSKDPISLYLSHEVTDIFRNDKDIYSVWNYWDRTILVRDKKSMNKKVIKSKFVFIWAWGWSLPLFQGSKVPERKEYGWFPVSGQWLICNNTKIIERHSVKVYGRAALDATPMSVPHLDTRIIDGKRFLLFGPYAGFTTKFLKKWSFLDLFKSIKWYNIKWMIKAWSLNLSLIKYLIKEVTQTPKDRLKSLQVFMPIAKLEDWELKEAWYRVQIIRADKKDWGRLQFGTEVVISEDKTLATLLGASPWAYTSVSIMAQLVEQCFPNYDKEQIIKLIPSYGIKLADDQDKTKEVRSWSHNILWIK